MKSIKSIYKIGYGPSSSHTMGPQIASANFLKKNNNATNFKVYLYGSLALTGKGHLTDYTILNTLGKNRTTVIFEYNKELPFHPNGMMFEAYDNDRLLDSWTVYSIGGGNIVDETNLLVEEDEVYEINNMEETLEYCLEHKLSLYDYIYQKEDESLKSYLGEAFEVMIASVNEGLSRDDVLPGCLKVNRRAKSVYQKYLQNHDFDTLVFAASLATSEMNASGGKIVTAPTCGSCGVIPGILYSFYVTNKYSKEELIKGLYVAGFIGNLIRTNASISGAEVGCQGEVGAASSMASAMVCYLQGGSLEQIEYAAEVGLEHHLGMTCDPVGGYVQIPCIERNAISAKRSLDCAKYALLTDGKHYITLDHVIKTMNETGKDLHQKYRETSLGGLAIGAFKCE